jgi:hypothetical protein
VVLVFCSKWPRRAQDGRRIFGFGLSRLRCALSTEGTPTVRVVIERVEKMIVEKKWKNGELRAVRRSPYPISFAALNDILNKKINK